MEDSRKLYITVSMVAILGVLLSTCAGALAGGFVGYLTGQKISRNIVEEQLGEFREWQREPVGPEQPEQLLPSEPYGALVTEVISNSPADLAGVQAGDMILAVDGERLDEANTLRAVIRRHRPGERVDMVLWRQGQRRTVRVRLGEHPEEDGAAYLGVYYVYPTE